MHETSDHGARERLGSFSTFFGHTVLAVGLSIARSSRHSTTMYSEHATHTYLPVIIMNGSEYVHEIDNVLEDQSTLTLIHHDHQ
jgi:hypothetical protein